MCDQASALRSLGSQHYSPDIFLGTLNVYILGVL